MKIAFYMEDGVEQIVLTPESEFERAMLQKMHDGTRELDVKKGSFFECRGHYWRHENNADESTMIVLRRRSVESIRSSLSPMAQSDDQPETIEK